MKPLIVLTVVFGISLFLTKIFRGTFEPALSGRIAMSVMLVFTAIAHFIFTKGMVMMLPKFVPFKTATVYITGIIEIAAAVGLLIPDLRIATAWLLIVFFLMVFPANIYSAIKQVNYQKAMLDGNGPSYLWFRVPLQVLFIVWVYFSAIKI